ncbi:taurine ABC transporter substrate-binding protein [Methylobacterium sp. 092160098-2]|uniref:taurine ABC transporter substrate-binding protein n=1 Tax=Methylobacterium sp. 092160098-2 TaxID=3025129 RepID=UPI0023819CE5|nr:taurine ABC transporter substrate-binding protein [Methylobacterium sp. 092160098-2]MDE4913551.1 taurine ABC transporter substrate-binding protein [Methylobacterium sp. 092160098-2]
MTSVGTHRPVALATLATLVLGLLAPGLARAADKEVTFAHQDMVVPFRALMASGALEKATGYTVHWRKFGGGDVIRAMASGSVQIGEAGSSPIAAAASQGLDIQLFWILDEIADAEQLVARAGSGVTRVADLRGKTIAVPFVSTAHYQLIAALAEAGLGQADVRILNMRPPEIAAAWERGDIDATFIWDPVLARVKPSGTVVVSAGDLARRGKATFDGLVVDRAWAAANRDFLVTLVKLIAAQDAAYAAKPWNADAPEVAAVARITGSAPAQVPASLAAYRFPTLEAQASPAWLGGAAAKALTETAAFLKAQGRVQALAPDYGRFVTTDVVDAARKGPVPGPEGR